MPGRIGGLLRENRLPRRPWQLPRVMLGVYRDEANGLFWRHAAEDMVGQAGVCSVPALGQCLFEPRRGGRDGGECQRAVERTVPWSCLPRGTRARRKASAPQNLPEIAHADQDLLPSGYADSQSLASLEFTGEDRVRKAKMFGNLRGRPFAGVERRFPLLGTQLLCAVDERADRMLMCR